MMDINQLDYKQQYYKKKYLKYKSKYLALKKLEGGFLRIKITNPLSGLREKIKENEENDKILDNAKSVFITEDIINYLANTYNQNSDVKIHNYNNIINNRNYNIILKIKERWSKPVKQLTKNDLQQIINKINIIENDLRPIIKQVFKELLNIKLQDTILKNYDKVVRYMKFDGTGKTNNLDNSQIRQFEEQKDLTNYLITLIKSYYNTLNIKARTDQTTK
jgi:ribosomal protein S13